MREKLIELVNNVLKCLPWGEVSSHTAGDVADYLLANGVTIQKWIPVSERLPEQGQEVIVYSGGVLKPTVFASQFWNKHYDSWARITHWMPLPSTEGLK